MFVSAIIAAGGRGQRLGASVPKQLLTVGGQTLLQRSVALFSAHPQIDEIVVALPPEVALDPPAYLREGPKPIHIVGGGARRQDSVVNAFRAISDAADLVVIHDAARPFATPALVSRTIAAAADGGAALAALRASDTVKRASAGEPAEVEQTLPRESIYLAQTPQAFRCEVLREALATASGGAEATDEAALVERAGHPVRLVEGEQTNIKVTTQEDLAIGESIVRRRGGSPPARTGRAGTGYDLHRLVAGRPLVLGGITIPFDRGPLGHSDGDVVCHAITDAILGALALGDIGGHFPDNDPAWKDASSLDLLRRAVELVGGAGYQIGNVDVTVVLEAPKIRPYVDAMREAIARTMNMTVDQVSIKGKTNEGVDAIGRGEAIAAHAVAQVRRG